MKNDILTLCDSAQDYNGQMVIVGTLTSFHVPIFPATRPLALAARFCFEQGEVDNLNVSLNMVKPNGSSLQLVHPSNILVAFNAPKSYLNLNMNLSSIIFDEPGIYKMLLRLNEQQFSTDLIIEGTKRESIQQQAQQAK